MTVSIRNENTGLKRVNPKKTEFHELSEVVTHSDFFSKLAVMKITEISLKKFGVEFFF